MNSKHKIAFFSLNFLQKFLHPVSCAQGNQGEVSAARL